MKVLRISHIENNQDVFRTAFAGKAADAKAVLKAVPSHVRTQCSVDEIDVQTDKVGVIAMLNGEPMCGKPTRSWLVTARGGFTEIDPES